MNTSVSDLLEPPEHPSTATNAGPGKHDNLAEHNEVVEHEPTPHADTATDPPATDARERRTRWGVFAYIALALVSVAAIWSLILQSVVVTRSGHTTDRLLGLMETGQRSYQQTIDGMQRQLELSRASLQTAFTSAREQSAATTAAVLDLASTNSKERQSIARSAISAATASSQRLLSLLAAAADQAQTSASAALTVAQTALTRARTAAAGRRDAASSRAQTARTAMQAATQRLLTSTLDRLTHIQTSVNDVLRRLQPSQLVPSAVRAALTHLNRAYQLVNDAIAKINVSVPGKDTAAAVRALLGRARSELGAVQHQLTRLSPHLRSIATRAPRVKTVTSPRQAQPSRRAPNTPNTLVGVR